MGVDICKYGAHGLCNSTVEIIPRLAVLLGGHTPVMSRYTYLVPLIRFLAIARDI